MPKKPGGAPQQPVSAEFLAELAKKLNLSSPSMITSAFYAGVDTNGYPKYNITVNTGTPGALAGYGRGTRRATTYTKLIGINSDGDIIVPYTKGNAFAGGSGVDEAQILKRMKDIWESRLMSAYGGNDIPGAGRPGGISYNSYLQFSKMIDNWTGSAASLDERMKLVMRNLPLGADATQSTGGQMDDNFDYGFGGGGGGGGFAGPVYQAPDRRVVEDMVKGMMVSLIGTVDDGAVEPLTNLYMADHRRNWDSPSQEIDPGQSVLEAIRKTQNYQSIHALRPDSKDERTWVSERRAAAAQGGLQTGEQEDFAISQATMGGDLPDVEDAGANRQVQVSGTARGTTIENKIRNAATSMFSGVRI